MRMEDKACMEVRSAVVCIRLPTQMGMLQPLSLVWQVAAGRLHWRGSRRVTEHQVLSSI